MTHALVISDSTTTANVISNVLSRSASDFLQVRACPPGKAAEARFDDALIVFVDHACPDCERMVDAIRESAPRTPVFILVPKRYLTDAVRRLAAGTCGILTKPLSADDLRDAVTRARLRSAEASGDRHGRVSVEYVNPFVEATRTTLERTAGVEARRIGLALRSGASEDPEDVAAVMEVDGQAHGYVSLVMPASLARAVTARMLGDADHDLNEEDMLDAVGELVNIIAGRARMAFERTPHHFDIGLPRTGRAADVAAPCCGDAPCLEIRYACGESAFAVRICLTAAKTAQAAAG